MTQPHKLIQGIIDAHATLEDLARAMASLDGKEAEFDAEKHMSARDAVFGHYLGYLTEMDEILRRAASYALERNSTRP